MKLEVGTVYHCKTEEDAIDLLARLHELGYKWKNSLLSDDKNYWYVFEKETCYRVTTGGILFSSKILIDDKIIEYKKHQVSYENLMRLIKALDITIEDSDIYDDREMLVVPKRTIHDEELIEIYKEMKE